MALRYALLGLLNYSDMTGYDLKKIFDDSIRNFWYASVSQIYRELNELEDKGYLASVVKPQADRPDKRIYSITGKGKEAFRDWITHFPQEFSKEKRDEFSLRLFFGSNLAKEELIREFQRLIAEKEAQLAEVEQFKGLVHSYTENLKLYGSEELYWNFILRRAEINLNATIGWARECIEELTRSE